VKVALVLLAAGRAAAEVLASRKAACEAVRLFVNWFVIGSLAGALGSGRDQRLGSAGFPVRHNGIGLIAFIGHHKTGLPGTPQGPCLRAVGPWSAREEKVDGLSSLLAPPVNLPGQSSSGTPQSLIRCLFFSPRRGWLVGWYEGGIDHEAGIALILGQWAEHTIPDAAGGPTREALVNPFVLAVALRPSRSRGRRNAAPTTRH
jgi:hypothetical protein